MAPDRLVPRKDEYVPPTGDEYHNAALWLFSKNLYVHQISRERSEPKAVNVNLPTQNQISEYESTIKQIFGDSVYNLKPEILSLFLSKIDHKIEIEKLGRKFMFRNFRASMSAAENRFEIHASGIAIPETRLHKLLLFAVNKNGRDYMCDFYTIYTPEQTDTIEQDVTLHVGSEMTSANDSTPFEIITTLLGGINPPSSWIKLKLGS
jgi:hypothetical protein